MKRFTEEEINHINNELVYQQQSGGGLFTDYTEQGIFYQPGGIPVKYDEYIVYMRLERRGVKGGSYHENSENESYDLENGDTPFTLLDYVIKEIDVNCSDEVKLEIYSQVGYNDETDNEYYGNFTEYEIRYIPLSTIYNIIQENKLNEIRELWKET